MTISFEQARELALKANAPAWRDLGNKGRYMVAPWGYEDADAWLIVDGAAELLIDHDYSFDVMDKPITLVMKATGEVLRVQYLQAEERIDKMTLVGEAPDDVDG
jgi:hypothetical protein